MTTFPQAPCSRRCLVVEAYRLDRYDNLVIVSLDTFTHVVEAYRLDRYDNIEQNIHCGHRVGL